MTRSRLMTNIDECQTGTVVRARFYDEGVGSLHVLVGQFLGATEEHVFIKKEGAGDRDCWWIKRKEVYDLFVIVRD